MLRDRKVHFECIIAGSGPWQQRLREQVAGLDLQKSVKITGDTVLQEELPDFLDIRSLLIDLVTFIGAKAPEPEVRDSAEVLGGRLKNLRVFGQ